MFTCSNSIDALITLALQEDIGLGDVTTESIIMPGMTGKARLLAKEDFILCGAPVFQRVFSRIDQECQLNWLQNDGDRVGTGTLLATVSGSLRGILMAERVALNFIQHLSGIATYTHAAVQNLKSSRIKLLDTRKTTPGMRRLEKYAVRTGGGFNHRFALDSGVLIKDNHIKAAGSITDAVARVRTNAPHLLRIEVEVSTIDELKEALAANVDIVMLDNMDIDTMQTAVQVVDGSVAIEVSGNMTPERLDAIAVLDIDYISMGALTHSSTAVDISLKVS